MSKVSISKKQKAELWDECFSATRVLCPICNYYIIEKDNYHAGHIIAESVGGNSTNNNLLSICAKCNLTMGSKYLIEYWLIQHKNDMKRCFINSTLNTEKKHYLARLMFEYLITNGIKPQNTGIYQQNIIPTNNFSDVIEIDGENNPNDPELWIHNKYSIFWSKFHQDFIVYENSIVMPKKYHDLEIQNYDIILTISKENADILLKIFSDKGFCFDFNNVLGINSKFNVYREDLKRYTIKNNCYQYVILRKGLRSVYNDKKGNFVIKIFQDISDVLPIN